MFEMSQHTESRQRARPQGEVVPGLAKRTIVAVSVLTVVVAPQAKRPLERVCWAGPGPFISQQTGQADHLAPGFQLALERPTGIGGAGGWQADHRQAQRAAVLRMAKALPAVVGDQTQLRAAALALGQVVDLRLADRAVEATFALAGGIHVPQADTFSEHPVDTLFIAICAYETRAGGPNGLKYLPEGILWVGVILLTCQRCDTGETTQHQHPGLAGNSGWQAV